MPVESSPGSLVAVSAVPRREDDDEFDVFAVSTSKLIRHTYSCLGLKWEELAVLLGEKTNLVINISRLSSTPSYNFRIKLFRFCEDRNIKDYRKFIIDGEDIGYKPTMSNFIAAMNLHQDSMKRGASIYKGKYIQFNATEDNKFTSSWINLEKFGKNVGVPRFTSWRPNNGRSIITAGYYFNSDDFLYLVSHRIGGVSIRYNVLARAKGRDLSGITSGVSLRNSMYASKCYMKAMEEDATRKENKNNIREFTAAEIKKEFPDAAEHLLQREGAGLIIRSSPY